MAAPLLDRDAELATIDAAVAETAAGRGAVIVLHGPAGIGKSALLAAARERAEAAGLRSLTARASELDRSFSLGVVHQLFEPLLAAATDAERERLLTGAAGRVSSFLGGPAADGADGGLTASHALYWLTVNVAEGQPVALLVDDLHWADAPSLRFLEYLGRRLDGLPVLLVATVRSDEPGAAPDVMEELLAGPAVRVLRPAPLDVDAVTQLLEDALGAAPDGAVGAAATRTTGGNPLLVAVLAAEARAAGVTGTADEAGRLEAIGARGVAPAVSRRMRALGPQAEAVVRAVAVLGPRASTADVAALADLDAAAALVTRERLVDAEVLAGDVAAVRDGASTVGGASTGGGWRFVHPLVGAAVSASTPAGDRDRLHTAAARRLRDAGARPAELAPHRLAAAPAGDPDAVADLRAAAAVAASDGAPEEAIALLDRALAEPPPTAERAAVTLALGELEVAAQRPTGVGRLQALLDDGLTGDEAARALAAIGTQLVHTDPVGALAGVERALAEATDPALRLRLEAFVFEALIFPDALAPAREARFAAAREDADPSHVALAHLAFDGIARGPAAGDAPAGGDEPAPGNPQWGTAANAVALAEAALASGALVHAVGPASSTWNLLAHAYRLAGDADRSAAMLRDGDRLIAERGLRAAVFFVEQAWGYWHRDFGSVATGAARAQVGLEAIREVGLEMTAPALSSIAAENLARLDRLDEAAVLAEAPFGPAVDSFMEPFALSARGYVRALQLRDADAEADLRRAVAVGDARGWHGPLTTRARLRLAELLARRGETAEARALAEQDLDTARAIGDPGATGLALRACALAAPAEAAIALLREAADTLRPTPHRLDLGWTLHDLGLRLRVGGGRQAAREPLREALDLAARTDGARLAAHARAELDSSGARPRRELLSGVEALTPAERRAAELAAGGLTNRQIAETLWVTLKTVELHLGRCYAKLGIGSRRDLADALGPGLAVAA